MPMVTTIHHEEGVDNSAENRNERIMNMLLSSSSSLSSPKDDYFGIRTFPPPSMNGGILPSQFLRKEEG
eukprot:12079363-Ditylum_brightwellii.AAC.1